MKKSLFLFVAFIGACGGRGGLFALIEASKDSFIKELEQKNNISYTKVENFGAYIPPQCYTKTFDADGTLHNPCYACHIQPKPPNFWNDTELQEAYSFPESMLVNPYKNLFIDKSEFVKSISDQEIIKYIRTSNYFDKDGEIKLKKIMLKDWKGYVPDCYFNFDQDGFDKNPKTGEYTGWVAYRYYPFPGTFWPTNGSTDDVILRLPQVFRQDKQGNFSKEIYKLNISILEAYIKQKDVKLDYTVDEKKLGQDLNDDGTLSTTDTIKFRTGLTFVGKAGELQTQGKLQIEPGLFPAGTEFLHTVRYIDFDENGNIRPSARIKEVRYSYKEEFYTSGEIKYMMDQKLKEIHPSFSVDPSSQLEGFPGDYEKGLKNIFGWRYSGYIEDKEGNLRPQTTQELISCMGCHDTIGATTDSTFSFVRKYAFGYWDKNYLKGVPEPKAHYKKFGEVYEYTFYLLNNKSGNEFRSNDEVIKKFFDANGNLRKDMAELLNRDISVLLYPSKDRALLLNKVYLWVVKNQGYRYGSVFDIKSLENTVHKEVKPRQETGIKELIY
uniref:Hypothetical conserved protein n=1 Tax=uncultured Aquificia bacterium TaxID=453415 RepID=H5SAX7_9BACT|nr:hypothetical conserved protein [uncultured Aquificae bacterium]